MNVLSKIQNSIVNAFAGPKAATRPSQPAVTTTPVPFRRPTGDVEPARFSPAPPAEADPGALADFARRFTSTEYFSDPVWNGKRWIANPQPFSENLAHLILGDRRPDQQDRLSQLCEQIGRSDDGIADMSWTAIRALTMRKESEIRRRIEAGEKVDPTSTVSDTDDLARQAAAIKRQHRAIQADLATEAHDILLPFFQSIRDTAQDMVIDLDRTERAAAADAGLEFKASQKLRSLIWFALEGWQTAISNYMPGLASYRPHPAWYGCELWPTIDSEASRERAEKVRRYHAQSGPPSRAPEYARIAVMHDGDAKAAQAAHLAAVAELNEKHDLWREQAQEDERKARALRDAARATPVRVIGQPEQESK